MKSFWWLLPVLLLTASCAQMPTVHDSPAADSSRRGQFYRMEIASQVVGFTIIVNGVEFLSFDGGRSFTGQVNINDWMISGDNTVSVTLSWPQGRVFTPTAELASFRIFANNSLIREFAWPAPDVPNERVSFPHTFTHTFRAGNFPRVLLGSGERVISSVGILSPADQSAITTKATQLRRAFIERDLDIINELLITKYRDLAAARFTSVAAVQAEQETIFRNLMEMPGYAVSFSGRSTFISTAEDRLVRLGQGPIGFPEPALVITWREGGRTERWEMELYFAKINGAWVILR